MPYLDARLSWASLLLLSTLHCGGDDPAQSTPTETSTSSGGASASAAVTTTDTVNTSAATTDNATTSSAAVTTSSGGSSATATTSTTTTASTTETSTSGGGSTSTDATVSTADAVTTSQGTTTGGSAGGGNLPLKGVANSPCQVRTDLGVSWYYNWMQYEDDPCDGDAGGEFVPMVWGHEGDEQSPSGIESAVASFVQSGFSHVLAFNEPDNPDQSNIPVGTAISLLPSFDNSSILIGSPATAANADPGQVWFDGFMTQLNADSSLRVDFLAIHWYGWNEGSCDASASQLESYINWVEGFAGDRPIWITEWGCLNNSAPSMDTVVEFYEGAIAMFENHPRIERYAWYPWSTNCGLSEDDGSLTALGEAFAAAPAYR